MAMKLIDHIEMFRWGAKTCLEHDGFVLPVLSFIQDGQVRMVLTQFSCQEDKDKFAKFLVDAIRDFRLTEYITVTEAWIVAGEAGGDIAAHLRANGSLRDAPGREEAVVICHCTPTRETLTFARIDRSGGTPCLGGWETTVREVPGLGAADAGQRFMGMFAKAAAQSN